MEHKKEATVPAVGWEYQTELVHLVPLNQCWYLKLTERERPALVTAVVHLTAGVMTQRTCMRVEVGQAVPLC